MSDDAFHTKEIDELFQCILNLKSVEECYEFFEDVCTIKELHSISQRLEVAKLLDTKTTFNEIAKITGASSATIARVNKCLQYGKGYKLVLKEINK